MQQPRVNNTAHAQHVRGSSDSRPNVVEVCQTLVLGKVPRVLAQLWANDVHLDRATACNGPPGHADGPLADHRAHKQCNVPADDDADQREQLDAL
jgi:hypothetical protein